MIADQAVGLIAGQVARLTGRPVRSARVVGGQHGYRHAEISFADGTRAFAKLAGAAEGARAAAGEGPSAGEGAEGALIAEARGLRWLGEADAVPVPEVLGADATALVISMVPASGPPSAADAHRFGGDLARLHRYGADCFGAPWHGYIAGLPLDNAPPDRSPAGPPPDNVPDNVPDNASASPPDSWPFWYAERRLLPFLRHATGTGALSEDDASLVRAVINRIDALAGPAEPPSRIHGDCWSGNVLWSGGRGWLIDPAAHGGHRETDLAMLALFGAPHLDAILDGYAAVAPLAPGWRSRVPLHQLHPLLVHACLFGAGYRSAVRDAAGAALSGGRG
jgi:fructosamine-3-kinase